MFYTSPLQPWYHWRHHFWTGVRWTFTILDYRFCLESITANQLEPIDFSDRSVSTLPVTIGSPLLSPFTITSCLTVVCNIKIRYGFFLSKCASRIKTEKFVALWHKLVVGKCKNYQKHFKSIFHVCFVNTNSFYRHYIAVYTTRMPAVVVPYGWTSICLMVVHQ